jgi:uncharacterized protein (DUF2235 family)
VSADVGASGLDLIADNIPESEWTDSGKGIIYCLEGGSNRVPPERKTEIIRLQPTCSEKKRTKKRWKESEQEGRKEIKTRKAIL